MSTARDLRWTFLSPQNVSRTNNEEKNFINFKSGGNFSPKNELLYEKNF